MARRRRKYTSHGHGQATFATWLSFTGRWAWQADFVTSTEEGLEDTESEAIAAAREAIDKREGRKW